MDVEGKQKTEKKHRTAFLRCHLTNRWWDGVDTVAHFIVMNHQHHDSEQAFQVLAFSKILEEKHLRWQHFHIDNYGWVYFFLHCLHKK